MIRKLHVALICSITLGSPAFAQSAVPEALYASIEAQDAFMRTIIRETFADQGEAVVERAFAVAGCESSGSPNEPIIHWETDGSGLLRNTAGGQARASFQVMPLIHREHLHIQGIDLEDVYAYMKFVRILYDGRGGNFGDWYPSESCWNPSFVRIAQN